jgi:hypothetical protein
MMKGVVVIALLLLVAAHSAPARKHSNTSPALDAVKLELRNPSSATFDNIRVHEGAVCGVVEAQKAAGVYTGRMLFV